MAGNLTQEMVEKSKTYIAPKVDVGQVVLWYKNGEKSGRPVPALVVRCDLHTIDVVQIPNIMRQGVRHVSDPFAVVDEMREHGAWDYTQESKDLAALKRTVADVLQTKSKAN